MIRHTAKGTKFEEKRTCTLRIRNFILGMAISLSSAITLQRNENFLKFGVVRFLSTEHDKSGSLYEGTWSQYQTFFVNKDNGFDMKQLNP